MAVINVHFKCNDICYVQKDGLAMGASLPVILANRWLKVYEKVLAMDIPQNIYNLEDMNGKRPNARTKAVECEDCLNWYHNVVGGVWDEDYKCISEKSSVLQIVQREA